MGTIISHNKLKEIRNRLRNKKIVLCGGSFDLPHLGHALHLLYCKKLGDILVVIIKPDKDVKRIKGNQRPILGQDIRLKTISLFKPVDYCFLGKEFQENEHSMSTLPEVLKELSPDIYVVNRDSEDILPYIKEVTLKHKIQLKIANRHHPLSSTKIIQKIKELI